VKAIQWALITGNGIFIGTNLIESIDVILSKLVSIDEFIEALLVLEMNEKSYRFNFRDELCLPLILHLVEAGEPYLQFCLHADGILDN
jgi:hypothetical protein